jgi:hypothetical protein
MCWQCDHPDKTLADYLDVLRSTIREHGWVIQAVEDDRAPYSYTVGLRQRGLPELLMTGLAPKRAARLLNHAAMHSLLAGVPAPGTRCRLLDGLPIEVVEVDHPDAHMGIAIAINRGRPLRARQLVWADSRHRWPWEPRFDNGMRRQPVLGRRVDSAQ